MTTNTAVTPQLIKIPKTVAAAGSLRLGKEWLTNGHWAIRRQRLAVGQREWSCEAWSAFAGYSCEELTEDAEAFVVAQLSAERIWKPTGFVELLKVREKKTERALDAVLYRAVDIPESVLGIDRRYWEMLLEPRELCAAKIEGPCVALGGDVVVMPIMNAGVKGGGP